MEDMERYGDYNEVDEVPKSRGPMGWVIRILVAIVIIAVVGVLGFRLVLFEYYPKSIKNLYFNETLTEYYEQTGGEIGAKTQHIRFPYDDSENGNFFSDHLVVIDGADQLQISIRLNVATIDAIEEKYKLEGLSRENLDYLSYRLVDNEGRVLGAGGAVVTDKAAMYRYAKLVFDGVDLFDREDGAAPSQWIRLEIFVDGGDSETPFAMLPIYENNETHNTFSDYALSRKERP